MEKQDRFIILLDLDVLKNEKKEIKDLATRLIRENLDVAEGINQRVLRMKMLDLEGLKDYILHAEIDAVGLPEEGYRIHFLFRIIVLI